MQNIIEELEKKKELMRNADPIRRRLDDNINYRKTKAKVDKLLSEIEILEESMLKVGVFDTIEKELQKLSKERERLLEEVFSYS
jgi:DNA repair protein RAD50